MYYKTNCPVILDIGSYSSKVGFANQIAPKSVFPTVTGHSRSGVFIGYEAQMKRDLLSSNNPIEYGVVTNWESFEMLLDHSFNKELRIRSDEQSVLITEAAMNPSSVKQNMAEILFERFNISSLCISQQALLSLFASGRTSGVVVDSGQDLTYIVPVHEANVLKGQTQYFEIAGQDLSNHLGKLLNIRKYNFESKTEQEILRRIKEMHCFVSLDIDREGYNSFNYKLPDGRFITVGSEVFECPEALFRPTLYCTEMNKGGLDLKICEVVNECDVGIRRGLYRNIVLTGGSSMMYGIGQRLKNELKRWTRDGEVFRQNDCKYSAWIGGAMFASLSSFKSFCLTRNEYDEHGPEVLNRKFDCFRDLKKKL